MLLFISDLHFVDETAGKHNVPAMTFKRMLKDLKRYGGKPSEIKIVFLGDIFDLNRSTYWLELDESERPWGDLENKKKQIEQHANHILDSILAKNQSTFNLLQGSLKKQFGFPVEPERVYIPGNHDRLCNLFPSLRKKVRENLGMEGGAEPFPHVYDDADYDNQYAVWARHGHEYDIWNYEGSDGLSEADYAQIPIGDLITTEITARLPYTLVQSLQNTLSPQPLCHLRRHLEEVENVRPPTAIFDWLFFQAKAHPEIKDKMGEALKGIVENFNNLPYLQRWYKRHDQWNLFTFDEADRLQTGLRMFKFLDLESVEGLLRLYTKIFGTPDAMPMENADQALMDKAKEFLTHQSDYRYCILGHTHNPMQVPIRITSKGIEQMYLNTGTWRAKHTKGLSGGFITLKNLTYTIVYSKKENPHQELETWTGSLKEIL